MYLNIHLTISIILILILINFSCDGFNEDAIPNLKSRINKYASNRTLIADKNQALKLKAERNGFAGSGFTSVVWICELHYVTSRRSRLLKKIKTGLSIKRNKSGKNVSGNLIEITQSQWDGKHVAVKFGLSFENHHKELNIYNILNAKDNPAVESFGIPAIYFAGTVLEDLPAFGMTMFEESIENRFKRPATLSQLNILCALYQAMFSLKFIHSHGIIHQDVKAANFMVRRGRLFLIDFNMASNVNDFPRVEDGNLLTCSVSLLLRLNRFWMDDLKSLYYTMIQLAGVQLPWYEAEPKRNILLDYKLDYKAVRNLCMKINSNYTIVRQVFLDFHDKVMLPTNPRYPKSVKEDRRIPLYDEIGEVILKGIEEIISCRDVLFKWIKSEGEGPTKDSLNKSSEIIEEYKKLPGAQLSQITNKDRPKPIVT